jgi:hypothetical protein
MPGNRVYDFADVLTDETVVALNQAIVRIDTRTGAQVVVYTQVKPDASTSTAAAEADARSLMDAWGVGRKGTMTASVILLDLTTPATAVQLYAAPLPRVVPPTRIVRRSSTTSCCPTCGPATSTRRCWRHG